MALQGSSRVQCLGCVAVGPLRVLGFRVLGLQVQLFRVPGSKVQAKSMLFSVAPYAMIRQLKYTSLCVSLQHRTCHGIQQKSLGTRRYVLFQHLRTETLKHAAPHTRNPPTLEPSSSKVSSSEPIITSMPETSSIVNGATRWRSPRESPRISRPCMQRSRRRCQGACTQFSLYLPVCLSVCLSVCGSIYLFIYLCIYLSVSIYI